MIAWFTRREKKKKKKSSSSLGATPIYRGVNLNAPEIVFELVSVALRAVSTF